MCCTTSEQWYLWTNTRSHSADSVSTRYALIMHQWGSKRPIREKTTIINIQWETLSQNSMKTLKRFLPPWMEVSCHLNILFFLHIKHRACINWRISSTNVAFSSLNFTTFLYLLEIPQQEHASLRKLVSELKNVLHEIKDSPQLKKKHTATTFPFGERWHFSIFTNLSLKFEVCTITFS